MENRINTTEKHFRQDLFRKKLRKMLKTNVRMDKSFLST